MPLRRRLSQTPQRFNRTISSHANYSPTSTESRPARFILVTVALGTRITKPRTFLTPENIPMNSASPPAYSPAEAPVYSAAPRNNEVLLATTRSSRRSPPTRTFTWFNSTIDLSAVGDIEGSEVPLYGRNGLLRAEIHVKDPSTVLSVAVQVR